MPWKLEDSARLQLIQSLSSDWMGTILRIVKEVAQYALDPVHEELEKLKMKSTHRSRRLDRVRQKSKAAKSVSQLGSLLSARKRDQEVVLSHVRILLDADLLHPSSIARIVSCKELKT
jgi:hypothetical protein